MCLYLESKLCFDEADDSELILHPITGRNLGTIDTLTSQKASINEGGIQMNVGALRHIKKLHAQQIQKEELYDISLFVWNVIRDYEKIYEGSNDSILLSKDYDENNAVVAIGFIDKDGVYRVKTAGIRRKRGFKNKRLLFERKGANPL